MEIEYTYQLVLGLDGEVSNILRSDGWCIPVDPTNSLYKEYQAWLAEGNQPFPPQSQLGQDETNTNV